MVISFSRLGLHGRLANQLFQIAGTLGLAEQYDAQAQFPVWKYQDYFTIQLPNGGRLANEPIKEEHFHYYEWKINRSGDIWGYMQSEKYFPRAGNPFKFKGTFLQRLKDKLPAWVWQRPTIALHIRRGDYIGNNCYYQLPITYFIGALVEHFPDWQNCNLVILSDDIPYCKVHFEGMPNVYFEDGLSEIEAMALGSMCDNYILSNSSFSWWMAQIGTTGVGGEYVNHKGKLCKRVVHPGANHFAGPLSRHDISDFWPERWIPYQKDSYALDLMDCTFTIPVYYDHKDRKQNLDLSVCMLQKDFRTNIIIGECKSRAFEYMKQYCKYVLYNHVHFHRTKMLNDMARMATTPYIANWDADIIIPPLQVYLTVKLLREGADMVFPYDGRFARWERLPWFKDLEKALDAGVFKGIEPTGSRGKSIEGMTSVGGAVFFNKQSFIAGGMENEKMISYGPEDCERNDRFTMLGYKIQRTHGHLHHINHWCGPNSNKFNIFFRANHAEIERIRAMDKISLLNYIKSWPWLKSNQV